MIVSWSPNDLYRELDPSLATPTEITLCVKGDMPLHLSMLLSLTALGVSWHVLCILPESVRLVLHRTLTSSKWATRSFGVIFLLVVAVWAGTSSPTLLSVASCHHYLGRRWPARLGENGRLTQ